MSFWTMCKSILVLRLLNINRKRYVNVSDKSGAVYISREDVFNVKISPNAAMVNKETGTRNASHNSIFVTFEFFGM